MKNIGKIYKREEKEKHIHTQIKNITFESRCGHILVIDYLLIIANNQ